MLFMLCVPSISTASALDETSLFLSKTTAVTGETVTAFGTAAPNGWVPLKIVDAAQSILYFDTTKADASGNYSIDFIVPKEASGTLTVIAGEASNIAAKNLIITETAPSVTLSLSKAEAKVGETVTAFGTAVPHGWVPLKIVDAAQSILYFDTTKADASGSYSIDFIVPTGASGTLTVIAGEGSNVAAKNLIITETAPSVTLSLSKAEAKVGETVTASGTAAPNGWVPLKIVDAAQNILYFDTTKADASGSYSIDFIVPTGASGTLTVIAGEGSNVATKELVISEMENVSKPSAWPLGGVVVAGTQVTLKTKTPGAVIYYTIDGSTPTTDSTEYNGPITISEPVTIKAIAVKTGMINSDMMTEHYTIAQPIEAPEVYINPDGSNKDLAITEDTLNLSSPVEITVPPSVTDATISVAALMNEPDESNEIVTDSLPALSIEASTEISPTAPVKLDIPAGTIINAPAGWNGTINVPRVEEKDTVVVTPDEGMTATVDTVIEVGFGDVPLTFSKAVRILVPGQGGKDAGYYRNNQFTPINSLPEGALDNQEWADDNIPEGGDGKLDVGSDLVIWTKHFTKFVTYTQTQIPTGSGGGGGGLQGVVSTNGMAMVTPSAGGTISLGNEATIKIPANALTGKNAVEVKVRKVIPPPAVLAGLKLMGSVYEFSVGGENNYNFAKDVTITIILDPTALNPGETPSVYYYDEAKGRWVDLGGTVSGNTISVKVDHFTKFAVFVAMEKEETILNDITGHWAENSIKKLVSIGAINGYPDGSFKPNNKITRAEFATVLVKAFQLSIGDGKTFTDTAGHWARDYIGAAADNGVVKGYDNGAFGPDDYIIREQMAVMVVKAAKLSAVTRDLSFADSEHISDWAVEAMATATGSGIIRGYPDNTVQPKGNATRAEAATVIINALEQSN
jgi:hypothetical protein